MRKIRGGAEAIKSHITDSEAEPDMVRLFEEEAIEVILIEAHQP